MRARGIEVRGLKVSGTDWPVSFCVSAGEIHALLGRSGSGKTTVLEIVSGCRRPVAGSVRVAGIDPYGHQTAIKLSTVWREGGLFPGLTVVEIVDTWRRWTLDPITRSEALSLAGLSNQPYTRFEQLTAVQRRSLDLALALIGRPNVVFLDEPTADLDPDARQEIWSTLSSIARRGVTILLATQDADEARMADSVTTLGDPPDEIVR